MQLSFFDFMEPIVNLDDVITNLANELLFLLNEGMKKKELYEPHFYYFEKEYLILIAVNKDKDVLMNIINAKTGKMPENFSVNWRDFEHIKQDLKQS
ncbi:hypothetical protein [Flavobacterium sp.]|uniref:hypothetical protein n=1 Tax=Flavobacterium sp. TaxID=239 RepID=UPI00374FFDCA